MIKTFFFHCDKSLLTDRLCSVSTVWPDERRRKDGWMHVEEEMKSGEEKKSSLHQCICRNTHVHTNTHKTCFISTVISHFFLLLFLILNFSSSPPIRSISLSSGRMTLIWSWYFYKTRLVQSGTGGWGVIVPSATKWSWKVTLCIKMRRGNPPWH